MAGYPKKSVEIRLRSRIQGRNRNTFTRNAAWCEKIYVYLSIEANLVTSKLLTVEFKYVFSPLHVPASGSKSHLLCMVQ